MNARQKQRYRARNGLVYALRANGVTCREIAQLLKVSTCRVQQIDEKIRRKIEWRADVRFPPPVDWEFYVPPRPPHPYMLKPSARIALYGAR